MVKKLLRTTVATAFGLLALTDAGEVECMSRAAKEACKRARMARLNKRVEPTKRGETRRETRKEEERKDNKETTSLDEETKRYIETLEKALEETNFTARESNFVGEKVGKLRDLLNSLELADAEGALTKKLNKASVTELLSPLYGIDENRKLEGAGATALLDRFKAMKCHTDESARRAKEKMEEASRKCLMALGLVDRAGVCPLGKGRDELLRTFGGLWEFGDDGTVKRDRHAEWTLLGYGLGTYQARETLRRIEPSVREFLEDIGLADKQTGLKDGVDKETVQTLVRDIWDIRNGRVDADNNSVEMNALRGLTNRCSPELLKKVKRTVKDIVEGRCADRNGVVRRDIDKKTIGTLLEDFWRIGTTGKMEQSEGLTREEIEAKLKELRGV
jgi:hypothetical protein